MCDDYRTTDYQSHFQASHGTITLSSNEILGIDGRDFAEAPPRTGGEMESRRQPRQRRSTVPNAGTHGKSGGGHEALLCPQCRQIDLVQKVSSIVEAGTTVGDFSGTSMGVGTALGHRDVSIVSGHST